MKWWLHSLHTAAKHVPCLPRRCLCARTPGPQARLLQLPSVMEVVALLDEPDPELLWMVGCVGGCVRR